MWVDFRIPENVEDEKGFVYWDGYLRAETEGGEWQEPVAVFPDRWRAGIESIEDAEMPPDDWLGDDRDIETLHVLSSEGWWLRKEALDAVEKVRSKSVERVVLLDAYVRYARETGQSDVWHEYVGEVEESSLTDFLEWLEEETIEELLVEATTMFRSARTCWT